MKTLEQPFSFGFKIKAIPFSQNTSKNIFKRRYECTVNGHNKFYEIILDFEPVIKNCYKITIKYGKIGGSTITDTKLYNTINNANKFIDSKEKEKLKKDYILINSTFTNK